MTDPRQRAVHRHLKEQHTLVPTAAFTRSVLRVADEHDPIRVAARNFARAHTRVVFEADATSMMRAVVDQEAAIHDLLVLCGEPCQCEDGTCPGPLLVRVPEQKSQRRSRTS